ncbi:MAG: outer rane chaperone Skp (OmpH) [Firmicutes bacterium]|nr:outer rane chaperone Skp (OmpH) [Bacillota bacterium]
MIILKHFRVVILAFVLVMGLASFSGTASAKSVTSTNAVGVVDFQFLMAQHPDTAVAEQTLKTEAEKAQKEFDEKSATMTTDQEKKDYYTQLQQGLNEKKNSFVESIQNKVIAAVKEVADAKGLAVVVDKSTTIYGGQDITNDVGKKIIGSK